MYGYIYKTTNLLNGKIYIGQKKSDVFLQEKYLGSGKKLKLAVKKYGKQNFSVELIECCSSQEELNEREIYWISEFNSRDRNVGYNISTGGEFGCNIWENLTEYEKIQLVNRIQSTKRRNYPEESFETRHKKSIALIGHTVSDETKEKISNSKKQFYQTDNGKQLREQLSEMYNGHEPWNKGKKMSEEYCQKSRDSHPNGWYNHTQETKQQISKTLKMKYASGELVQHSGIGKKRCINIDTNEEFDSLSSAAKKYNISNPNAIVKCSNGKHKTCGGYRWKVVE